LLQPLEIANPKRRLDLKQAEMRRLFPYYAGFSSAFVDSMLSLFDLPPGAKVLDPWNGSGTTTAEAFRHGLIAVGSDLNPVMNLVAKADFVSRLDVESFMPLAHSLVDSLDDAVTPLADDPLGKWFHPMSVRLVRSLEERINRTFLAHENYTLLASQKALDRVTPLAAFFYVALFRVIRRLAQSFTASNPTWIRVAKISSEKKHITQRDLAKLFVQEVELLCGHKERFPILREADTERLRILMSNSESIPLESETIDAIVTSPPYCTRIDYAVATYLELGLLRIGGPSFTELRSTLMGSSTVQKATIGVNDAWGGECRKFLRSVFEHPSKASNTYYYKSHLKYFNSLYKSLSESARVLASHAHCALVVQNSYYKEIRNDVALIVEEMAEGLSLQLVGRKDFSASRSMVEVNQRSKKYLEKRSTVESVLIFRKN